jgi:hypothetical protein
VPGASDEACRVKNLNANWTAGADGEDGHFDIQIITRDDEQHSLAPSPAAMTALIALTQSDAVLGLGSTEPDTDRGEPRRHDGVD